MTPDQIDPKEAREMVGVMVTDGVRLWEVVGYDGTDPRGGAAFLVADARDALDLSPRDRASKRVTQDWLDRMEHVGLGGAV